MWVVKGVLLMKWDRGVYETNKFINNSKSNYKASLLSVINNVNVRKENNKAFIFMIKKGASPL